MAIAVLSLNVGAATQWNDPARDEQAGNASMVDCHYPHVDIVEFDVTGANGVATVTLTMLDRGSHVYCGGIETPLFAGGQYAALGTSGPDFAAVMNVAPSLTFGEFWFPEGTVAVGRVVSDGESITWRFPLAGSVEVGGHHRSYDLSGEAFHWWAIAEGSFLAGIEFHDEIVTGDLPFT